MFALLDSEVLDLWITAVLGTATTATALVAAYRGSSYSARKRLSYAVVSLNFEAETDATSQELRAALQNTGRDDFDATDLLALKLAFPNEATGSRIEAARVWRKNPPGLPVSTVEPKAESERARHHYERLALPGYEVEDGSWWFGMDGMNRGDFVVLHLVVSGYTRDLPPRLTAWIPGGEIKELPVEFSAAARVSGIALGALGTLAMVYAAWHHSEPLIGVGLAAVVVGVIVHGYARRRVRLRLAWILGGPEA